MWVVVLICGQSYESLPLLMALLISSKMKRGRKLIKETNSFGCVAKTNRECGLNIIYLLLWSCRQPVPAALSLLFLVFGLYTLYLCAPETVLSLSTTLVKDTMYTGCLIILDLMFLYNFYFYFYFCFYFS